MQKNYNRTPMPKCISNKVTKQLIGLPLELQFLKQLMNKICELKEQEEVGFFLFHFSFCKLKFLSDFVPVISFSRHYSEKTDVHEKVND